MSMDFPTNEEDLEELLSRPNELCIEAVRQMAGDFILLGVGGKMGPSLARMIKRATEAIGKKVRVFGVARFTNAKGESALREHNIETIRCDLLKHDELLRLPKTPNVIYMAGMKFGSTGNESMTWGMNCFLPGLICQQFQQSRIAAFSTGNVYGMTPIGDGGSTEKDSLRPEGEYAMSCLGRERILEHCSRQLSIPMSIIRLNYACDLRYGVVVDLAKNILERKPIDLSMGYFNTIWQGDANALTVAAMMKAQVGSYVVNVSGVEQYSVRQVAETLAHQWKVPVHFTGTEAPTALLTNVNKCCSEIGESEVDGSKLIEWVGDWISKGGATLGKPTHFESRDGKF